MQLYVIRHAIAEDRHPDRIDAARSLTREGIRRFEQHVRALERMEVRLSRVLHSPWRRAAQTAELLAGLTDHPPLAVDALAAPPREALLDALVGGEVAVVGHEPWLGELIAWLVLGDADLGERFPLKKGGVAHLEGTPRPGGMILRALWTPKLLRLAGG